MRREVDSVDTQKIRVLGRKIEVVVRSDNNGFLVGLPESKPLTIGHIHIASMFGWGATLEEALKNIKTGIREAETRQESVTGPGVDGYQEMVCYYVHVSGTVPSLLGSFRKPNMNDYKRHGWPEFWFYTVILIGLCCLYVYELANATYLWCGVLCLIIPFYTAVTYHFRLKVVGELFTYTAILLGIGAFIGFVV